ncbi:interleukin-15 receptor subunit alpha isoform X2 [Cricetulus griseus]|uniref:Interleukin-15 receptor subunit alpha n=1 Tax=Cricetulus griseus TaxID=10029 RepID=A0A061ICG2_CRIGR|nr:interleukin-15 receptor subunit alpha isoform X2 [Cricetulus griseus]XP_027295681.1 interleukin-15 receptor subunit alpha isoform X2 [Cricetulus griseus]ERE80720.1 interleukin-15 receptor subunit alpha-like protein [Cricetulus griseus]
MTSRHLRGCGVHALQVLLLLLLLLLPLRVTPGTTCPTPISVEHADIRVKNYSVNSRERYVCNSGFKRKAGTSSLTECVINKNTNTAHWTTPNLKCIRDPSLAYQSPVLPSTVVTTTVTPQPESPSPPEKEISPNSSKMTKVAISTSVLTLLVGAGVVALLVCYIRSRQTSQPHGVEMETMEAVPMTVRPRSNEDDTEA